MDLRDILATIRQQAIVVAQEGWSELGTLVDSTLPDPLSPIALLPVATGKAVGGKISELIPVAAATLLVDVSLRIVDDCADMDDPNALYQSIGVGRAMNYAMALNTVATRKLSSSPLPPDRLAKLLDKYFHSFLQVCQGQDYDIDKRVKTLSEYREVVTLKTVAAYEFSSVVGALVATSDTNAITLCSKCGIHLGWMAQILDDIEALWFPLKGNDPAIERLTFPILLGLITNHPNAQLLEQLCHRQRYDRVKVCTLLDEMHTRTRLLTLALDHRDKAIEALSEPLDPAGAVILKLWLDWLLSDGMRLLSDCPSDI